MKKLDCIIADDEKLARDVLENYISRIDKLNLVGVCRNALDVYNLLQKREIDILFLDIQMPQLTGINLIKSLTKPPQVVFTTAYKEYAVEAFELRAADYLLKPFSFERFLQAVDTVSHQRQSVTSNDEHIDLKVDRKMVKVLINDILYIEAVGNYIKVHLSGKSLMTYCTIQNIKKLLPVPKFRQIHRSYIVNFDKVTEYTSTIVMLKETALPVGRNYKRSLPTSPRSF
jgi:DNA-binding LytR/AlgR family response regulator